MNADDKNLVDRIAELGGNFKPQLAGPDGDPLIVLPEDFKIEGLSTFLPLKRIRQIVRLLEAGSFITYVNRFKGADTLIFANVSETGASFSAVLDYHCSAERDLKPAYCQHRAEFSLIETPEWKAWKAADRKAMDQVAFATWLEDNASLIAEPNSATLLELVRSLHGHKNARFNTSLRLDNGAYSTDYEEDVSVKGSSGIQNGSMDLPPEIMGGFAVFQGCEAYRVRARLKVRVEGRKLLLWFETIAVHQIVRESIMLAVTQIAEGTEIIPLLGNS